MGEMEVGPRHSRRPHQGLDGFQVEYLTHLVGLGACL